VSSRREQKAEARRQRLEAEREREAQQRRRRAVRLAGFGVAVVAAIVGIVLVAGGGSDSDPDSEKTADGGGSVVGAGESRQLLEGIPQDGTSLGNPNAKLVLTEYADLQCPFCARYATEVLPQLIEEYVRPGKLRLELRLLRFLGPDSDRGAQAAHVAADRDRMWQFVDLWYRNQGPENSDYADDNFIRDLAEAAGAPAQEAVDAAGSGARGETIEQAEQEAELQVIDSTPSFVLGAQAGTGRRVEVGDLSFEAFRQALAPELR
jgi:protein-disulfide isomerase